MDWTRGHTIGQGSSATVSLATSLPSGDIFAAKSTELSQSHFLQREQHILSSLNPSPHIVTYKGYDITKENNKLMYNLHLEYAPGGSLMDTIRQNGLDESTIVYYTRQMLQGLDYLHSNGLVHCDIKGRNILVTESGAKIADFGCAKWECEVEIQNGGTPMFMAPEVARGEHQGFASDIWSIGCTVIEMVTGGGAPWVNVTDPVSVLFKIAYSGELPEFPGFLSDHGKDFLSKCLRRDPKERWTASQLLKHPFLDQQFFSYNTKLRIQESNSCSPTSILDQRIWNSIEDEETEEESSMRNVISVSERTRRLSSTEGPNWEWSESWVTIRENDMICGSVSDSISEENCLDFSRADFSCENSVVISNNLHLQRLLLPSIS